MKEFESIDSPRRIFLVKQEKEKVGSQKPLSRLYLDLNRMLRLNLLQDELIHPHCLWVIKEKQSEIHNYKYTCSFYQSAFKFKINLLFLIFSYYSIIRLFLTSVIAWTFFLAEVDCMILFRSFIMNINIFGYIFILLFSRLNNSSKQAWVSYSTYMGS